MSGLRGHANEIVHTYIHFHFVPVHRIFLIAPVIFFFYLFFFFVKKFIYNIFYIRTVDDDNNYKNIMCVSCTIDTSIKLTALPTSFNPPQPIKKKLSPRNIRLTHREKALSLIQALITAPPTH